jgi:glutathione S-transferase
MSIPDAELHPCATGAAAQTVAQHQDPQDVVFYSGWFCPFVQRTWLVLEEKGIPYQYVETNPYKKDPEYLKINPKGLVPSIVYDGRSIYESGVLNEFLEDAFPNIGPSLFPPHPADRARARMWIDHLNKSVLPANFRLQQAQTAELQDANRKELIEGLKKFQDAMDSEGPWFFGEQISLVDLSVAPWIVRDWVNRENRGYRREDVGERWVRYAKALEERESVIKTTSVSTVSPFPSRLQGLI